MWSARFSRGRKRKTPSAVAQEVVSAFMRSIVRKLDLRIRRLYAFHASYLAHGAPGVSTFHSGEEGCCGLNGPVPKPLWIRSHQGFSIVIRSISWHNSRNLSRTDGSRSGVLHRFVPHL